MPQNKQFILAIVLSALVVFAWQFLVYEPPGEPAQPSEQQTIPAGTMSEGSLAPTPSGENAAPAAEPGTLLSPSQALALTPRIAIDTPKIKGSINLKGARIDDLKLRDYRVTTNPSSPIITLLSPADTAKAYYVDQGWAAGNGDTAVVPTSKTVWTATPGARLTPSHPVTLSWDNRHGLIFKRTISVDDHYLFTIRQQVENTSGKPVKLFPYALISRHGTPKTAGFYILHEGMIGSFDDDELAQTKYDDLQEESEPQSHETVGGWLGITDKYWAVALIPDQTRAVKARFLDTKTAGGDVYQADYLLRDGIRVPPGATASYQSRLFSGAKVVQLVDGYASQYRIKHFDLLIDWGWFYFITKPMFWLLEFFKAMVGNFGIAILMTTVVVKLLFFPLAHKSYVAMSKMKKLQPELMKLRERYRGDRVKQQEAMMALYKKEKVNPASGCLPMVIQIPVFFSLYKVLFVTIEMRHAPFFGWIKDLSAPDPTSVFNLFGLLPWTPPGLLMIGVWPLIMGMTMWVQMRLNPTPPDRVQAKLFNLMPIFFTFLLARFPSGLVIYWAWNNTLSVLQQYVIMRRQGVEVALLSNILQGLGLGRQKGVKKL
ncbi:MAG: membrane protein insertase YidC [Hyphomicrobiales bacterium]